MEKKQINTEPYLKRAKTENEGNWYLGNLTKLFHQIYIVILSGKIIMVGEKLRILDLGEDTTLGSRYSVIRTRNEQRISYNYRFQVKNNIAETKSCIGI
jgi:hypothetical protein